MRGHPDRVPPPPRIPRPNARARARAPRIPAAVRPMDTIDWDADTGWMDVLRGMDDVDADVCQYASADHLKVENRAAYTRVWCEVAKHGFAGDEETHRLGRRLMGLLPRLLLTDGEKIHDNRNVFLERCNQVMELRGLDELLGRGTVGRRRRLVAARSDARTKKDVLKSTRRGQYSRAGQILMRDEVARATPSTEQAAAALFPNREEELDDLPRPAEQNRNRMSRRVCARSRLCDREHGLYCTHSAMFAVLRLRSKGFEKF